MLYKIRKVRNYNKYKVFKIDDKSIITIYDTKTEAINKCHELNKIFLKKLSLCIEFE